MHLLVSLGGVIQEAITAFTVTNDQITFSNPPLLMQISLSLLWVQAVSIGTPADGTIDATKLKKFW